jgi:hypothetical protein
MPGLADILPQPQTQGLAAILPPPSPAGPLEAIAQGIKSAPSDLLAVGKAGLGMAKNVATDLGNAARLAGATVGIGADGLGMGIANMSPAERSSAAGGAALLAGGPVEKLATEGLLKAGLPAIAAKLAAGGAYWGGAGAAQNAIAGRSPQEIAAGGGLAAILGAGAHALAAPGEAAGKWPLPTEQGTGPVAEPLTTAPTHPVGALTVRGKTGVIPEPGAVYHGTANPALTKENLDASLTKVDNLFGQGVYLTDNPDIAASYAHGKAGPGGVPVVYKSQLGDIKALDLEKPATPEVIAAYAKAKPGFPSDEGTPELDAAIKKPGVTGQELHQALSNDATEASHQEGLPSHEFLESFDNVTNALREQGYDALTHTGGLRIGKVQHKVTILLDPQDYGMVGRKPDIQSFEPAPTATPFRTVPIYAAPNPKTQAFATGTSRAEIEAERAANAAKIAPKPVPPNLREQLVQSPLTGGPAGLVTPAYDELANLGAGGRESANMLRRMAKNEDLNLGEARHQLGDEKAMPVPDSPLDMAISRRLRGLVPPEEAGNAANEGAAKQQGYYQSWLSRAAAAGHMIRDEHGDMVPVPPVPENDYMPRPSVPVNVLRDPGNPITMNVTRGLYEEGAAKSPEQAAQMVRARVALADGIENGDTAGAIKALVKNGKADNETQALNMLKRQALTPGRQLGSSASYARTGNDNLFFDRSATRTAIRFMHESEPALARTEALGPDTEGNGMAGLADALKKVPAKLSQRALQLVNYIDKGPNKEGVAGQMLDSMGRGLSRSVIGPFTTLEHAFQPQNLTLRVEPKAWAEALEHMTSHDAETQAADREFAVHAGVMNPEAMQHYQDAMGGGQGTMSNMQMKGIGMTDTYMKNRFAAALAGRAETRNWADMLVRNPTSQRARYELTTLGADPDEVLKNGGATQDDLRRGALHVADDTIFQGHRGNMPMWMGETSGGRMFGRLKSFLYNQSNLVAKQTVGRLAEGDKAGGAWRAARTAGILATLFPATTMVVNKTKDWVEGKQEPEGAGAQYAKAATGVPTLGYGSSLIQAGAAAVRHKDYSPILGAMTGQPLERAAHGIEEGLQMGFGSSKPGPKGAAPANQLSQYQKQQAFGENVPFVGYGLAPTAFPTKTAGTSGLPAILHNAGIGPVTPEGNMVVLRGQLNDAKKSLAVANRYNDHAEAVRQGRLITQYQNQLAKMAQDRKAARQ